MGMIRKGRERLGATRDSLRSEAGVGKETLGGCRQSHAETPRHERLFEVTEVGADVRFVERDGLHRRRRFTSELADAHAQLEQLWPLADLFLQPKVRSAPRAALGRLEIQLPLYPRKQTQLGHRGMSEKGGGFNRSRQHILRTSQLGSDRARSFAAFH